MLLRLGRTAEAFAVADGARGRGLLEHLGAVRRDAAGAVPPELVEGESLLRRIDALVQRLRRSDATAPRDRGALAADDEVAARLAAARAEYEALMLRAVRRDARATALLGASRPTLGAVRAALAPDELLVEYLVTRARRRRAAGRA